MHILKSIRPLVLALLLLDCSRLPTEPSIYDLSQARFEIITSTGMKSENSVVDTLGNKVYVGIYPTDSEYIDSAILLINSNTNSIYNRSIIFKGLDTVWDTILLKDSNDYHIKITSYIKNGSIKVADGLIKVAWYPTWKSVGLASNLLCDGTSIVDALNKDTLLLTNQGILYQSFDGGVSFQSVQRLDSFYVNDVKLISNKIAIIVAPYSYYYDQDYSTYFLFNVCNDSIQSSFYSNNTSITLDRKVWSCDSYNRFCNSIYDPETCFYVDGYYKNFRPLLITHNPFIIYAQCPDSSFAIFYDKTTSYSSYPSLTHSGVWNDWNIPTINSNFSSDTGGSVLCINNGAKAILYKTFHYDIETYYCNEVLPNNISFNTIIPCDSINFWILAGDSHGYYNYDCLNQSSYIKANNIDIQRIIATYNLKSLIAISYNDSIYQMFH